jgi:hypothetical protein
LHENSISHSELTIEKLYSQFYVNYNALINHKHLLDSSSEQYLKKELKSAYRKIILISKGQSKKIKNMLFDNRVGLSFKDKVRLTIGWFSLKIFNKGELFFR